MIWEYCLLWLLCCLSRYQLLESTTQETIHQDRQTDSSSASSGSHSFSSNYSLNLGPLDQTGADPGLRSTGGRGGVQTGNRNPGGSCSYFLPFVARKMRSDLLGAGRLLLCEVHLWSEHLTVVGRVAILWFRQNLDVSTPFGEHDPPPHTHR